uniref:Uncharacterized protein n=1 Tax=Tanacetum cinerariifolium TaxID=118510 RepID=A0A699GFM9_TANCI|nr:hypothetical protein [Tanacetum cinerariifolium]
MHAVEAAHHITVDHVHDRFRDVVLDALEGGHAFLDDEVGDLPAILDDDHLVALGLGQVLDFIGVLDGQDAGAIGPGVGLDDHERLLVLHAVFLVLLLDFREQRIDVGRQAFIALAGAEVHRVALGVQRVEHPRIDADQLAEFLGHFVIRVQVVALAAQRPARVQRRQQALLVYVLQDLGDAGRQVVIEQNRARIEILQSHAAAVGRAHQRFDHQQITVGQRQRRRLRDLGRQRTEPHVQPGLAEDLHQPGDVLPVGGMALLQLGNQEQVARVRAIFVDCGHGGLHRQRQHFGGEMVEAAGEQVGIHGRQLVAGVTHVDRTIKRRRVLLPFQTEPALNGRRRGQDFFFEIEQWAGQGRGEAFAFLFFRHAQTDHDIDQLEGNKGHDARPQDGGADSSCLHHHLTGDRVIGRRLVGHVVEDTLAAQRWRSEHAGQDRTEDTAHAVHAEDVQRVIGAQQAFQTVHAPQADHASEQTHDQGAHRTDETAGRRNCHQARYGARSATEHRWLAFEDPFGKDPRHGGGRGGQQGVDEGQGRDVARFQRRAGVETEPADPQQRSADHGHGHRVRRHRFAAVTDAFADHVGTDQAGDSGVDVHHGTASGIERALLEQETGFQGFGGQGGGVLDRVRTGPEPDHVGDRQVSEREPQHHEGQHGDELDALGKGADDQRASDGGKRRLERHEQELGNHDALGKGGGVGKRAFDGVVNIVEEGAVVQVAEEGITFGESQRVANSARPGIVIITTSRVATIIQALSPFCGVGAAAGAASAAGAAAAAGVPTGAPTTGVAMAGAPASAGAVTAAGASAGLASCAWTGAARANRIDTPASNVVIVFFIKIPLKSFVAGFTGTNAYHLFQVVHKDFAVTDLAGAGCAFDRFDRLLDDGVIDRRFDLGLREEVHHVFGATVQLGVALLAAEAFDFGHRDALHIDCRQCLAYLIELERLDNGGVGVGFDRGQAHRHHAEVLGHADLVIAIAEVAVVLDVLVAGVQVQHKAVIDVVVELAVEVAAVLAVGSAEQVGGRLRVFHRERAGADLGVQFKRVGAGAQLVRRIVVIQAAHVVGKGVVDLSAFTCVHIPFDVGIAARVLDPLDIGGPASAAGVASWACAEALMVANAKVNAAAVRVRVRLLFWLIILSL